MYLIQHKLTRRGEMLLSLKISIFNRRGFFIQSYERQKILSWQYEQQDKGLNRLYTKSVFQSMFQSEGTNIGLPVVITNIREATGDLIFVNSNAIDVFKII